jgi:hypothetical protein
LGQHAVEGNQSGGGFVRKTKDAALGWVQAHLQRIERQFAVDRNDELAIEHEVGVRERAQVHEHFREEAGEGFARLGLDFNLSAGAERQAPEAVPFGLELPATRVRGQLRHEQSFHRAHRERHTQFG